MILHDCVSMIMPTIQAGFIIIYKLSLHFPSQLKQVQTKRIYLETNKENKLTVTKEEKAGEE